MGGEPVAVSVVIPEALGKSEERALIWGGLTTYMLSAVILSALGYPAFTVGTITGTPEVRPSRSSRTEDPHTVRRKGSLLICF